MRRFAIQTGGSCCRWTGSHFLWTAWLVWMMMMMCLGSRKRWVYSGHSQLVGNTFFISFVCYVRFASAYGVKRKSTIPIAAVPRTASSKSFPKRIESNTLTITTLPSDSKSVSSRIRHKTSIGTSSPLHNMEINLRWLLPGLCGSLFLEFQVLAN